MQGLRCAALVYSATASFVFTFGCQQNRVHACGQSAIEIALLKMRLDFVLNDPFAERVRKCAFQTVTGLNSHLATLNKYQQKRAVVCPFLADAPRLVNALRIICQRRIRLHFWKNRDDNLAGGFPLKIFKFCIQLLGGRRRDCVGVIVEITGWFRWHDFRRLQ